MDENIECEFNQSDELVNEHDIESVYVFCNDDDDEHENYLPQNNQFEDEGLFLFDFFIFLN